MRLEYVKKPETEHCKDTKAKEFGSRLWEPTKFACGLLLGGALLSSACSDNSQKTALNGNNDIYTTPYSADILKDENGSYYMGSRFVVTFINETSDAEVQRIADTVGGRITGKIKGLNAYEIEVAESDLDSSINTIISESNVEGAGRNYFATTFTTLDNDTYTGADSDELWWSKNIRLSEAYGVIDQAGITLNPVTVAVIDESFDLDLRDLKDQYVSKVYHWDFGDNDNDVSSADMLGVYASLGFLDTRPILHGTETSCLCGCANNDIMMNGAMLSANVLPLKIMSRTLLQEIASRLSGMLIGDDFRVAAAMSYAYSIKDEVNLGVISLSLGFDGLIKPPMITSKATASLSDAGIIIVAAVGNESKDFSATFPAALPGVISVGAVARHKDNTYIDKTDNLPKPCYPDNTNDAQEERACFSNYSTSDAINISAPGANVLTEVRISPELVNLLGDLFGAKANMADGSFESTSSFSGTSASTPIIAGVVALLKSINPNLSRDEAVNLLRNNADDVPLSDDPVPELRGIVWKRINVERTMGAILPPAPSKCNVIASGVTEATMSNGKIIFTQNPLPKIYDISTGTISDAKPGCTRFAGDGLLCYDTSNIYVSSIETSGGKSYPPPPSCMNINYGNIGAWGDIVACTSGYTLYVSNLADSTTATLVSATGGPYVDVSGSMLAYVANAKIMFYDLSTKTTFDTGVDVSTLYYPRPAVSGQRAVFYSSLPANPNSGETILVDASSSSTVLTTLATTTTVYELQNYGISGNFVVYDLYSLAGSSIELYDIQAKTTRVLFNGLVRQPTIESDISVDVDGNYATIITADYNLLLCSLQ